MYNISPKIKYLKHGIILGPIVNVKYNCVSCIKLRFRYNVCDLFSRQYVFSMLTDLFLVSAHVVPNLLLS